MGGRAYSILSTNNGAGAGGGKLAVYDDSGGGYRIVVDPSGNVGIGTTMPGYRLHVNGAVAGTSWTNLSSRDYKEGLAHVTAAEYASMPATLVSLDVTRYRYRAEYGDDRTQHIGFIAEDMPSDVRSPDGKRVDVYELVAYVVGGLKALWADMTTLSGQIASLKKLASSSEREIRANGVRLDACELSGSELGELRAEIIALRAEIAELKRRAD